MSASGAFKGAGSKSGRDHKWPMEGGSNETDSPAKKMKSKTTTAGACESARTRKQPAKEGSNKNV